MTIAAPLFCRFAILFLMLLNGASAVISMEPKIVYVDGRSRWDTCIPGLKRSVTGESGLLISHSSYGSQPYNGSRNCFLTITVPVEYRIRIKVLDFEVYGNSRRCDKDTLHIFDHEESIDPNRLESLTTEQRAPGQILGQFCGTIASSSKNSSYMAVSTHNVLTLWWHTDANLSREISHAEGFRLLWSSFRPRSSRRDHCKSDTEFQCRVPECIPLALGCNAYADCADESDLDTALQINHNCEHIPSDVFSQLTGVKKLLICLTIGSFFVCTCFFSCACFYLCRPTKKVNQKTRDTLLAGNGVIDQKQSHPSSKSATIDSELIQVHSTTNQPPMPPNFSPPQVPQMGSEPYHHSTLSPPKATQQLPLGVPHAKSRTAVQPPLVLAESSSAIVSTSASSHNNQSTTSSLNTSSTAAGAPNLPRTTHLHGLELPPNKGTIKPYLQPGNKQTSGGQPISSAGTGEYTYVQNEQRHLLL
ncbi:CUB domain-containing protein [Ditylenchus destructor]|uniref:CUB domain-containing protein n=1 Tax=Ditylenchus destructor TaxID=166010 RepID=A0AAD4NCG7_9BILA|nr:CUB domain-containing protein [Ditylenchus destructor]